MADPDVADAAVLPTWIGVDSLNRTALVAEIVARTGIGTRQARALVDAFMDALVQAVVDGREVRLAAVRISSRTVPARRARNPKTGDPVAVPARPKLTFRPGPRLLNALGLSREERRKAKDAKEVDDATR